MTRLRHRFDTALSIASDQLQTMSSEQISAETPPNTAPLNLTLEGLGNANRVFLIKRKNPHSSSAAGSPPTAVKTEPSSSAEALGHPQVTQPTQASSAQSTTDLSGPLFISCNEHSRRGSQSPTSLSPQGMSTRLATVSIASNMDTKNQVASTSMAASSGPLPAGTAPSTTPIQARNINPRKSFDIGGCITGTMVSVMIGLALEPTTLHMNVLCHQSKYFKDKYEQFQFASGASKVTLENVKTSVFQHWTACAYGNSFTVTMEDIEKAYQVYYLASDLRSPDTQDTAMDAIRMAYRDARGWPTQQRITTAYRNTSIGSPVRRFLTECVYFSLVKNGTDVDDYFGDSGFSHEFVLDYIRMSQEMSRSDGTLVDPRFKEGCEFHTHTHADLCNA